MMDFEPAYNRFSLAQMGQRVAASGVDIVACLMLSSLLEALVGISAVSGAGELIFCFVWLFDRVLIPTKSQGQSIGRWAMNLRVVDTEFGKTANIVALARREATILIAMLIWIASLDSLTGAVILALVPVVVDIAPAFVDIDRRQALHDKIGDTIVINSRKGFELEQKLLNFFGQANKFVRTSQRSLQQRSGQYGDRSGYSDYQDIDQNRYASRSQRQRSTTPYGDDRGRTRAPESYGQAYREEVDPVDRYAGSEDDGDFYDHSERWDDDVDYRQDRQADDLGNDIGDPSDRYAGQSSSRADRARGQSNPGYDRSERQDRRNRQTNRDTEQDWGDDDRYSSRGNDREHDRYNDQAEVDDQDYTDRYDPGSYNTGRDDIDARDRYNRSDSRQSPREDYDAPRRRSSRSRSNQPNQRRSPRRRNEY